MLNINVKQICETIFNMKSKILLTGATGYIGYNIAKQLLQTGYSLRFFVRNPKDCISLSANDNKEKFNKIVK